MVIFDRDECIRAGHHGGEARGAPARSRASISFGGKEIIITAGNSCPTNDGVSAALLMSEEQGARARPRAARAHRRHRRRRREAAGDGPRPDPLDEEGAPPRRHRAPTRSTASSSTRRSPRRCSRRCKRARHPARDSVNVNGGSIAIGHPLGATGARLVTTVAQELRRSGRRYGLATQCIGAGMGISTILERID